MTQQIAYETMSSWTQIKYLKHEHWYYADDTTIYTLISCIGMRVKQKGSILFW